MTKNYKERKKKIIKSLKILRYFIILSIFFTLLSCIHTQASFERTAKNFLPWGHMHHQAELTLIISLFSLITLVWGSVSALIDLFDLESKEESEEEEATSSAK